MKKFNIAKHHYIINGIHVPINCVYGTFILCVKYKTNETREVFSKGKKYVKPVYKTREEKITYYCDNFRMCKMNSGESPAYNVHIWDSSRERWIKTNTAYKAKYNQLGLFLAEMFEKNDIRPTTKCIPWIDGLRQSAPDEKRATVYSDSPFRASVGYALSKNVMTCHNVNRDGWAYDNITRSKYGC